jgi:hypothetical protein
MANSDSNGSVYYDANSYYGSSRSGNIIKKKSGISTSGQVQKVSVTPDEAVYASNNSSYYNTSGNSVYNSTGTTSNSVYNSTGTTSNSAYNSTGSNVYTGIYNYGTTDTSSSVTNYGSNSVTNSTGANNSSTIINNLKSIYNGGSGSYAVASASSASSLSDGVAVQTTKSTYTKPTEEQLDRYYEYLEKFSDFDTPIQIYDDLGLVEKKLTSIEDSLSGCSGEVFKRVNTYLAQYEDYIKQARSYVSNSLSPVTEKIRLLKGYLEQRAGKEYEVVDALEDQPFYYLKDSTDPVERQTYEELAALYTPRSAVAATQTSNKEELDEQINTLLKEICDLSDFTFYDRRSMYDYLEGTATAATTSVDTSELDSLTSLIETRYSELAKKGYTKAEILTTLSEEIKNLSKGTDTAVAASKSISSSNTSSTTSTSSDIESELQRIYNQLKSIGDSGTYSQKETYEILDNYVKNGKSLSSISIDDLNKVVKLSSYTN